MTTTEALQWKQPRRVDVWWWMEIEQIEIDADCHDGYRLIRGGRVSWNQDGTGLYEVSLDCAREGHGFYCWPDFRALSDAQTFVEELMALPFEDIKRLHGTQWPGVVL